MIGVRNPIPGVVYPPPERLRAYVETGALPQTTLAEALIASFRRHADRVALWTAGGAVDYAVLDAVTDRLAGAFLGMGLEPLDRVLFQSSNSAELLYAIVACFKAGLVPVCTLAAHRESEIGYLGRHVDARMHVVEGAGDARFDLVGFAQKMRDEIPTIRHVVALGGAARDGVAQVDALIASVDAEQARALVQAVPRDPYQVAIFQLSGGTTGVPKVIPRMQNDYLLNATLTADILGYRPDDTLFMPMPMIHNACMICFWILALLTGSSFAIARDMSVEAWTEVFREARPSYVGLIRALLPRLDMVSARDPALLDCVRAFWSADAARLLRETYDRPAFGMFGMSEGMNMYCRRDDPEEVRDWMVGRPLSPCDEVRLTVPGGDDDAAAGEIGEMRCRGPYTLAGYYNAPDRNAEAFDADGFYKAGDLMVRHEIAGGSYFAFAGRTKDVVDRGTEKINCEEVENAVSTHADISACAVIGAPDLTLGERVCAYLVVRDGRPAPDVAALQRHLTALGLAKFKWPERVEVVPVLPLTKIGKLDKAQLRDDIRARIAAEGGKVDA